MPIKLEIAPKIIPNIATVYTDVNRVFMEYIDNSVDSAEEFFNKDDNSYSKNHRIPINSLKKTVKVYHSACNLYFNSIKQCSIDKIEEIEKNRRNIHNESADKLIKNGTYFSQAISCAPETLPSLAAIFTSIYPSSSLVSDKNLRTMNPKLKNHLQILKENNYQIFTSHHRLTHKMQLDEIIDNVESFRYSSLTHDGLGNRIIQKLKVI